jgi:hypothetical protein
MITASESSTRAAAFEIEAFAPVDRHAAPARDAGGVPDQTLAEQLSEVSLDGLHRTAARELKTYAAGS